MEENELIQRLRAQGHRLTPQRRLILEVLEHSDRHLSADEIAQALIANYPTIVIDHATIYRTLKWLCDSHLVGETSMGGNHMVYALLSQHHHHHLVCKRCRTVIEVEPRIFEPVREALLNCFGFEAYMDHIAVFGLCAGCRS